MQTHEIVGDVANGWVVLAPHRHLAKSPASSRCLRAMARSSASTATGRATLPTPRRCSETRSSACTRRRNRRCHDDALRRGQVVVRRPVRPASVTARVRLPTTTSTSKSSGSAPFMQPTCTTWWRNPRRCRFDINRVRTMRPPTSMRCRRRSCTRHWSILRNRSPADLPIIRWMLAGLRVVQHEFAWVEECRDRQYRRDLAWEVSPW